MKMKKIIGRFTFLLLPFLLIGCILFDNFGYPSKMSFGRDGGTKICTGDESFYNLTISDNDGNEYNTPVEREDDTIIITKDWLTLKYKWGECQFKVIAEPNTTGKKRSYNVFAMVDNQFASIKITQER